jgi:hypothetical protein
MQPIPRPPGHVPPGHVQQLRVDQILKQRLGPGERAVKQRASDPRGHVRRIQQPQPAEQAPLLLA